MKKLKVMLLSFVLVLALAGCGNSGSSDNAQSAVNEMPASETTAIQTSETPAAAQAPEDGIDVDLTALSSTMVYSEVYNMMIYPQDYIGKTVKMEGLFRYYHDEETDKYYFACVIQDATACCAQGIEFVLTDEYTYPDDYPEADSKICVIGTFDTYTEGPVTYCTLRNAKLA